MLQITTFIIILLTGVLSCVTPDTKQNPSQVISSSAQETNSATLDVWRRAPGYYAGIESPEIKGIKKIHYAHLNPVKRSLFDPQYGRKYEYEGVSLSKVLAAANKPTEETHLLLHFSNGMIIPIARGSAGQVFLATKFRKNDKGTFNSDFPKIMKKDERFNDPRPVTFEKNKVIYTGEWPNQHVSPWKYASSLTGIELVFYDAYMEQFQPKRLSDNTKLGFKVFEERCQFCHGVRYVGARMGWDYVEPIPIFEKRDKKSLYYHIKYTPIDALERGLMMPNQKNVTPKEISQLWEWIKEVAKKKPNRYRPN